MPRRFHTQKLRRSGCTTCKARHKKCDEQKPRCRNCVRRNLLCDQPDIFRTAMLSITKATRPEPPTRVPTCITLASEVNSVNDLGEINDVDDADDGTLEDLPDMNEPASPVSISTSSTSSGSSTGKPAPCTALTIQPDASEMERYLLHHYTSRMSSLLINVDSPTNPLRSVLLPRAVVSPILKDALFAVAALHVSVGKDHPKFRTTSLAYYDNALSAFHHRITELQQRPQRYDLEVLLLTAVFLCKYEIISGGTSNWRSHLQGVREMLEAFQSKHINLAPEATSYVRSFIRYHSNVATITQTGTSDSPSAVNQDVDNDQELCIGHIDPYMGISTKYISLLRVAAEAIALDPTEASNAFVMMSHAINIFNALQLEAQVSAHTDPDDDIDQVTMTYIRHIAEAYRYAIVAYLHTILNLIEGHETSTGLMLQVVGMRTLLANTKEDALSACVQEMQCVPDDESCAVGLVPLLFIVASETRDQDQFNIGTERLAKVFQKACLGNIVPALELLHKTRRTGTGDWRKILRAYRWDLIVV